MDGSGPARYPPEKPHFDPIYGQKIIELTTVGLEGWDQAQNVGIEKEKSNKIPLKRFDAWLKPLYPSNARFILLTVINISIIDTIVGTNLVPSAPSPCQEIQ